MSWLQTLISWDSALFQWINSGLSNSFFDALLPFCRERWFWMPVYLFLGAFLWINYPGRRKWFIIFGLVASAALTDLTSSRLVKNQVQRLRPCREPALSGVVIRRVECGGGYSFTSSHAANHFAVAIFLIGVFGRLFPWIRPAALVWAGTIAFSQVYVGVHYPGDVLCGGILGSIIGWWVLTTWRRLGWV